MSAASIYQIQKGNPIETDNFIYPEMFYDNDELKVWSDYFYDNEEIDYTTFSELSNRFSKDIFSNVVKIDAEKETITLYPGFKEVWFGWKFESFKALASEATLEDFTDTYFEYKIRTLLGASFDDFIYDSEDGYPKKIDKYFRDLQLNEPITFYCGGIVSFHY